MNAIAQRLRDARLSQRHPVTGRPWSQEYAVERIREEAGWTTLYRPNYIGWENGRGMAPETLERLVAFWASHGVAGPDLTPPEPAPDLPTALMALARELEASRLGRERAEERAESAERALAALASRVAALEAAARPERSAPRG